MRSLDTKTKPSAAGKNAFLNERYSLKILCFYMIYTNVLYNYCSTTITATESPNAKCDQQKCYP